MVKNTRIYLRESRQPLTEAKTPSWVKNLQKLYKGKEIKYFINNKNISLEEFIKRINAATEGEGLKMKGPTWDRFTHGKDTLMNKNPEAGTEEFTYKITTDGSAQNNDETEDDENTPNKEVSDAGTKEKSTTDTKEKSNNYIPNIMINKDSKIELFPIKDKDNFWRIIFKLDGKDIFAFDKVATVKSVSSGLLKKSGELDQDISNIENKQSSSSDMDSDGADFIEENFRVRRKR